MFFNDNLFTDSVLSYPSESFTYEEENLHKYTIFHHQKINDYRRHQSSAFPANNAIKRSSIIHLPLYPVVNQMQNPPPSPFYVRDAPEDDRINDEESSEMLTREVKKDMKDEAEVDYYNQWIMSNVG